MHWDEACFWILTAGSCEHVALQAKAKMKMETMNWSREKTSRIALIPWLWIWEGGKKKRSNITKISSIPLKVTFHFFLKYLLLSPFYLFSFFLFFSYCFLIIYMCMLLLLLMLRPFISWLLLLVVEVKLNLSFVNEKGDIFFYSGSLIDVHDENTEYRKTASVSEAGPPWGKRQFQRKYDDAERCSDRAKNVHCNSTLDLREKKEQIKSKTPLQNHPNLSYATNWEQFNYNLITIK